MKIVADENIPFVRQCFEKLGEVFTYPGRRINSDIVKDADILLVRSITKVDENLLGGSNVRFAATATIGIDHLDIDYLRKQEVKFASAAGCNANSVAEYIVAALLILARRHEFSLSEKTIGIVGVGNVGSRVVEKAGILNMNILQNDPPLERKTHYAHFRPLEELLEQSDILTLHVPLSYDGQDKTYHLADADLFEKMKNGSFLINTSRGAVVNNTSLLTALEQSKLSGAVLDVWEGEPEINEELLGAVDIGTPHIAGYSLDGKTNAALLIYQAACNFLNVQCDWKTPQLPPPQHPEIRIDADKKNDEQILAEAVEKACDLERDDQALRKILKIPLPERKKFFDELRSEYPTRREFNSIQVNVKGINHKVGEKLKALGFTMVVSKITGKM